MEATGSRNLGISRQSPTSPDLTTPRHRRIGGMSSRQTHEDAATFGTLALVLSTPWSMLAIRSQTIPPVDNDAYCWR